MSTFSKDTLFKEASDWSYNEPVSGNVAAHSDTGGVIQQKNGKRATWVLPRCFNTIGVIRPHPKVIKNIEVPSGVKLICVVASSNASDNEVVKQGKKLDATARDAAAETIDKLITVASVKLDGVPIPISNIQRTLPPISGHKINFPKGHMVLHDIKKYNHKAGSNLPISSVFRYVEIGPLSPGIHVIEMYAYSDESAENKEPEWENSLAYIVNVPANV